MPALAKFLLVIVLMVGSAVYFHFNREEQQFSKALFGEHSNTQDIIDGQQRERKLS